MGSCRCRVVGRVQGVWFRKFTERLANRLGINGYVRNLPDGSVEVGATWSDEEQFRKFMEGLREGPPLARVDGIEMEEIEERFSGGFRIVP
ncbi:MAG: acylphosphatase [Epsilonproteobacteria bacterium]|nr:acylphosphatase [Campylobacterota bacterium]NPA56604.1 acylphosphatase [Campylobacterota bacterium]